MNAYKLYMMDKTEGSIKNSKEEKRTKILQMVDELDEDDGEKPTLQIEKEKKKGPA